MEILFIINAVLVLIPWSICVICVTVITLLQLSFWIFNKKYNSKFINVLMDGKHELEYGTFAIGGAILCLIPIIGGAIAIKMMCLFIKEYFEL